jgi:DNA-binding response OmpR family regulator
MKALLFTPHGSVALPLVRALYQSPIQVEVCDSLERFEFLVTTDAYSAVVVRLERAEHYTWLHTKRDYNLMIILAPECAGQRETLHEAGITYCYLEPFPYSQLITDICLSAYLPTHDRVAAYRSSCFELDVVGRAARYRETLLALTRTEFDLLSLLIRKRGSVLTRTHIWEEVWGYEEYPLANTVDVHVSRLRRKLPQDGAGLIQTVYGIGYRLQEEA